jgi:hypothetical protein
MSIALPVSDVRPVGERLRADAAALARTVLLGTALGAFMLGVLGRLGMFALARLNPRAAGLLSDDGFVIDQFTVSGSLQLLSTGGFFGALSGVLYTALAPLKTGPTWFQRLSLSVGAGVVVSSQIIHPDGVDFVVLDRPAQLGVAIFLAIPIVHVLVLDVLAERVRDGGALRARGWTAVGSVLCVPFLPLLAPLALGRAGWLALARRTPDAGWLRHPAWAWALRLVLTVVFVLAVASIVSDVQALS